MGKFELGNVAVIENLKSEDGTVGLKQFEGILAESEKRLTSLLETVQVGIMLMDAETHTIVDINHRALEMFGAPKEEVIGSVCHRFICPTREGNCPITDLGQELDNSERNMLTVTGDEVPIIKTVTPLEIQGRPHLLESFLDISELKEAQRSVRDSEARYRDLFDNVNDLIMMVRPDQTIEYANQACVAALGHGTDALQRLTMQEILDPGHASNWTALLEMLLRNGGTRTVESSFVAISGRRIPVEGSITCKMEDGRPVGVRCIWRDITERKEVELQREEWSRSLERKVEEKTRQLEAAQAKFVQTEKMAALGELAAGAAHELNNPLAGIIGAVQVLRQGKVRQLDDAESGGLPLQEEAEWLEQVEKAAGTCQKVVEDLQRFARPGKSQFKATDLNEIVRETVEFFQFQVAQDGIKIGTDLDAGLPRVLGDQVQLQQVLINILINARNALEDGGTIRVSSSRVLESAEVRRVQVVIHDDGCGIPQENLPKIFDPFFSTQPVGQGTGLGLTVSYGIVRGHGGEIEISSPTGGGTSVIITLPAWLPRAVEETKSTN